MPWGGPPTAQDLFRVIYVHSKRVDYTVAATIQRRIPARIYYYAFVRLPGSGASVLLDYGVSVNYYSTAVASPTACRTIRPLLPGTAVYTTYSSTAAVAPF